ncbi:MAG: DUF4390 domain-containing protein [Thermoanaerobaculia bacterium]
MRVLAIACLLALAVSTPVRPATLSDVFELAEFQVALDGRQVSASFRLQPGLPEELVARIQSGLPTGLTYEFRLYIDHIRWFDNGIDDARLHVVAMYNASTREYLVNYKFDGKLVDSKVVRSVEELERAMTRFQGVPLFTLGNVRTERRLLLRARADVGSRTIYSFIPTAVTTEWVESKKFRPPPGLK